MAEVDGWKEYYTADGIAYYFNAETQETSWDKPDCMKTEEEMEGQGDLFWAPHAEEGYVCGKVIQTYMDGSKDLVLDSGEIHTTHPDDELHPASKVMMNKNMDDLVQMDEITEQMITHNLRKRFHNDQIYTNIGTILISVNPFRRLPLYTPSVIDDYAHRGKRTLPPHVFGIAEEAYRGMVEQTKNQSILISGESGAGKTEATKQCLMFFAEVAGSVSGVEQNILLANPILEAFGNAKTLRNNNSSRFGKLISVHFDNHMRICGADTINYLLEKSRIAFQLEGERNFHVFYQLLAGAPDEWRDEFQLWTPDDYMLINQSGCIELPDMDDAAEFAEVLEGMTNLAFTAQEQHDVFQIVAAVLHLGNLEFEKSAARNVDASAVSNREQLSICAKLLGVTDAGLEKAVTTRMMEIRGQAATSIPLDPVKARDSAMALAKQVYSKLFDWLVQRINISMAPPKGTKTSVISVLDIFGFEIFDQNSFEQLCINFANEKLQQHFNQHTFKLEEQLYRAEQIQYTHVEFIDNQPMLDLIEKKPKGILVTLDEEIVVPKGSDQTFLQKIHKAHGQGKHPNYFQPLKSRTDFVINHYAGDVTYNSDGFLEKNKDTLNKDVLDLLEGSGFGLMQTLFPPAKAKKTRKVSLGGQFRTQLTDLMKTLNMTEPHYIRCVKPNPDKAAQDFRGTMCLEQLRYAGVFEAVRIRQTGYPFRHSHDDFRKRYGFMVPEHKSVKGAKAICKAILAGLAASSKMNFDECQIGNTRVLYRAPEHRNLELLRNVAVEKITIVLQAWQRRIIVHKMVKRLLEIRPILRDAIRQRTIPALEAALQEAADAEFEIKEIIDAKALKILVAAEERVTATMQSLVSQDPERVYDQLQKAVLEAEEINFSSPLVQQCRDIYELTTQKRVCRKELEEATAKSERGRLEAALAESERLGMSSANPLVVAAKAEVDRIIKEEQVIAQLDAAIAHGFSVDWDHSTIVFEHLDAALAEGAAFGCRTADGVRRMEEGQLIRDIRRCLYEEAWKELGKYLKQCITISFTNPEVSAAQDELSHKCAVDDVLERLQEAIASFDQDSLAYGLDQAQRLQMDQQEVHDGRVLLDQIIHCRSIIEAAVAAVDEDQLRESVAYADAFSYNTEEIDHARHLLKEVIRIKKDLATGLHYFEREVMEKAVADAAEINLQTEVRDEVEGWLSVSDEKFLQQQLKTANKLHDPARAIRIQIKMKDLFFESHGKMFVFKQYGNLRTPELYSKAKMFGRDKLKLSMLVWTKEPIPTSLTNLSQLHAKQAVKLFKNILGFMGDRSLPYVTQLAQDFIEQGLATPEIRDELYCQLIKQLTENPNPSSVAKGWQLMEYALQTFAPGDDFANYLEMVLRTRKPGEQKYLDMLHDTQYGPQKMSAPSVDQMIGKTEYKPYILVDAATEINPDEVIVADTSKAALPPSLGGASISLANAPVPPAAMGSVVSSTPLSVAGAPDASLFAAASAIPPPSAAASAAIPSGFPAASAAVSVPQPHQAQAQEEAYEEEAYEEEEEPYYEEEAAVPVEAAPPPIPSKPDVPQCRVLYDHDGQDARQLTIRVGDVITVTGKPYEGWWQGELNGQEGIFPSNYVEMI